MTKPVRRKLSKKAIAQYLESGGKMETLTNAGGCKLCGKPKKIVEHGWCLDCLKQCEDVYGRKIECDGCGHLFSRDNIAMAEDGNICRKCIERKDKKHAQDSQGQ